MSHSQPSTAERSSRRGRRAVEQARGDQRDRRVAHAVDSSRTSGDAAGGAHQLAVGLAVGLHPAQPGVERAVELRRAAAAPASGRTRLGSSSAASCERGDEERLLGREVVVEQRLRDARLAGDRRHRQLVVGVRGEQRAAALEQQAAPLVDRQPAESGDPLVMAMCQPSRIVTRVVKPVRPASYRRGDPGRRGGRGPLAARRRAAHRGDRRGAAHAASRRCRAWAPAVTIFGSARTPPDAPGLRDRARRSPGGWARPASRSSPAAARGRWRPPTAARRRRA